MEHNRNHTIMKRSTPLTGTRLGSSLPRACVGAVVIGICLLMTGQSAVADTFSNAPSRDMTDSMGAFQLVVNPDFAFLFAPNPTYYYPGYDPSSGVLTSPVLLDTNATVIELSASHVRNVPAEPYFPVTVGTAAGAPYFPDSISSYNEYAAIPFSFATEPNNFDELMTEIESFNLATTSNNFSCPGDPRVPGGQMTYTMVVAGPDEISNLPQNLRSIGMVQQLSTSPPDFPAQSFFDIFVQVNLPSLPGNDSSVYFPMTGAILYNDANNPLIIVNTNLTSLPPTVVYIHGQTTAVPLRFKYNNLPYWGANDILGYLSLAGHGVFSNTCFGSTGQGSNCNICAEAQTVLNATLGPVGSPANPMPVPWPRSSNLFPTPGTGYNSLVNRPSSGSILDAVVNFSTNTSTLYARDFAMSGLTNPISLPASSSSVNYTNTNTVLDLQLSIDDTSFSSVVTTGLVVMSITNTNLPSGSTTVYSMQIQQLMTTGSSIFGLIWLRADPSNSSLGQHTSAPDGQNYDVSSFFDVFFDISTDNVHWIPANGSIRMQVSLPPPAPHHISIAFMPGVGSSSNSVVLNWGGSSFTLQSTTNMSLPFVDVTGPITNAPYTNNISGIPQKFFRLRN